MNKASNDRDPIDPTKRGYHVAYRLGETNHCPGCNKTQWIIGRQMAECADERCATALPLIEAQGMAGTASHSGIRSWSGSVRETALAA